MPEKLELPEWDGSTIDKMEGKYIRLAVKYAALLERGKFKQAKAVAKKIMEIDTDLLDYERFDSMEQLLQSYIAELFPDS